MCFSALLASGMAPASARVVAKPRAHARPAAAAVVPSAEKDAAIVVDGATGKVLYARNADAVRKPASLTKMMTLYLLFEELQEGNLTLASKLTASTHAANQEPTKLGVAPGDQITVELAIKAITVLSANDVAVMIAEAIGKSEDAFGKRMTDKAHDLGMMTSNFHNASGLPDPQQLTSARDMALLGRHLAYDFPQYYSYFATPSFSYEGRTYESHDHLLGAFDGVDGIKTGYTRASGFNLVTSVVRGNKHVVGVVMGGLSYASRDQEMVRLLSSAFDYAQQNPGMLADANPPWRGGKGPVADPFNTRPGVMVASLKTTPTPAPAPQQAQPEPAAAVIAAAIISAPIPTLARLTLPVPKPENIPAAQPAAQPVTVASIQVLPKAKPQRGTPATTVVAANTAPKAPVPFAAAVPIPAKYKAPLSAPADAKSGVILASAATPARPKLMQGDITGLSMLFNAMRRDKSVPAKKWSVQIGAFTNEHIAQAELASYAKLSPDALAQAQKMVTPFSSFDGHKLYRARFGNFAEDQARSICTAMQRRGQPCFATGSN